MACFVAPMAEAIIVMAVKVIVEKKEQRILAEGISLKQSKGTSKSKLDHSSQTDLSWSRKLSWLSNMLWGGVLLLALEHLWHGEIVPWPPFLTALNNPAEIAPMLHEIATVGIVMALCVTFVWAIMVIIAEHKVKHIPAKAV